MPLSHLPALLATAFADLAHWLDRRSAARVPLLARWASSSPAGRRTVTSWFRAAGITDDFRQAYVTVCAVGRARRRTWPSPSCAPSGPCSARSACSWPSTTPPPPRYGPCVEGAGIHHNPTPGPAGEKYVYGHVWVTLAALAKHPDWGTIALPLQAQLYVRKVDLPKLPPERPRHFRTKLEMAVEQLRWAEAVGRPPLRGALGGRRWRLRQEAVPQAAPGRTGFTVVSRLRKDAALWSLPEPAKPGQQRGPQADLRQAAHQPGQACRADSAAGSRWSACSTARR